MQTLVAAIYREMADFWRAAFKGDDFFHVFATEFTLRSSLEKARNAELVLFSVVGGVEQGLGWVKEIRRNASHCRIAAVGIPHEENLVLAYIEAGASGFAFQDASLDEVRKTLCDVYRGEANIDPAIAAALIHRLSTLKRYSWAPHDNGRRLQALTKRESEVLELISERLTNQEIADRLVIEVGTVKNHVHSILDKLEVDSRHKAAVYYRSTSSTRRRSPR